MSVLVPTFSERETGQSGGRRQRLGRAVDRLLAAGAEGAILQALGSGLPAGGGNGRPCGQRPHAGTHRESPGRAGRPCAAVRCAPGSPRSSPASTDSTHKPPCSSAPGIPVASANRHRIPAGVESGAAVLHPSRGWSLGRVPIGQLAPWPPRLWTSRRRGPAPSGQTASRAHAGWLIWRRAADRSAYHLHLPLGRSPAPAHTCERGESVEEIPSARPGSRNVAGCCCTISGAGRVWCVAARGVAAGPGLPRHGLPSGRLPGPAPRARHPRAQRRAGEQRGCRAGGHRACLGACLAGLARRRARRLRAHPAHRGRVPARPCHRHDGQVAPACGLIVGMLAVFGSSA